MLRNGASGPDIGITGRVFGRILVWKFLESALRQILRLSRLESGRYPARKLHVRPESAIAQHGVCVVTDTGGLKPPRSHQMKGQTA